MLGLNHIIYISVVFFVTVLFHFLIKRGKINFDRFLKLTAVIALCMDPLYWTWEYADFGKFNFATTLPLYMCSLFWFLLPVVAFSKKRGILYRTSLSCLVTVVYYGAMMGLFFNYHVSQHPFTHFVVQRSLFYHFLMFLVITLMWSTGYYRVQKCDKFLFPIPLLILMLPAFYVDCLYGYDYCYFNGGKGSLFEYFSDALGIPLFVVSLYGLIFLSIYITLSAVQKKQGPRGENS